MKRHFIFVLCLHLVSAPSWADEPNARQYENWPQWRGPLANGVAPHGDPPVTWSEDSNIKWKVVIEGEGSGTPIVWNDRVFVLRAIETDRPAKHAPTADPRAKTRPPANDFRFDVICFDRATGQIRWQRTACEDVPHEGRHPTNTFASASPTTDGRRLYVSFASRGIYCYDLEGALLWQRDLGDARTRYGWGEAASPVVHRDSLVVN